MAGWPRSRWSCQRRKLAYGNSRASQRREYGQPTCRFSPLRVVTIISTTSCFFFMRLFQPLTDLLRLLQDFELRLQLLGLALEGLLLRVAGPRRAPLFPIAQCL